MIDLGPFVEADRHFALLQHVLDEFEPAGTAVEFGVGTGTSTKLIAKRMPVIAVDGFSGLPEDWRKGFRKGKFAMQTIPLVPNTTIVMGLFADVLPKLDFSSVGDIALCHFDADLFSSTKIALDHVGPFLRRGVYCVFDEFHGFPTAEQHEARAFNEYIDASGTEWEPVGHSFQQAAFRML